MSIIRSVALVACFLIAGESNGHEIVHTVTHDEATIVTLRYADGTPFSYEGYEIYYHEEQIAHQVGRTDAHGTVAFVADRPGSWRLRAFSEDGHGVDFAFETLQTTGSPTSVGSSMFRLERIVTGVAVLFGLFGILALLRRRSA